MQASAPLTILEGASRSKQQAACSKAKLEMLGCRKYPGATIVTDSVTSNGLAAYIKERGGKHLRYRRGYKNVISKGAPVPLITYTDVALAQGQALL